MKELLARKKQDIVLLVIDLAVVVLSWGGFYRESFGTDTLFRRMMPMSDIGGALDQQRYASYFLAKLLYDRGILITDHYRAFFVLFLVTIAVNMWLLQKLFWRTAGNNRRGDDLMIFGYVSCTALIFSNVLFAENFMFPEYHVNYAFAYLFGTLAVCAFAGRKYIKGVFCTIVACLFYQVAIVYAAILISAYLVLEQEFLLDRKLLLRELLCNALIGAVGILDYLSNGWIKALGWLEEEAAGKVIHPGFPGNLLNILDETRLLLNNCLRLLPPVWTPLIVTLISGVILFAALFKKDRKRLITLLLLAVVEIAWYILMPLLSGDQPLTPRVGFVFFAVQAALIFAAMRMTEKVGVRRFLAVITIGFLLLHIFFDQAIIGDRYLSNRLDELYANAVLRRIERYEEETGIRVTKVAVENDAYAPNSYAEVRFKREQINERVLAVSPFTLLEYVNGPGIALEHVDMDPQIYEQYFGDRDWDHFDPDEQLVIIDDTLYWAVF